MKCVCGRKLRIVRTVEAGSAGKASEAACLRCLRTYVTVTMILHEQEGYGSGAQAIARRMRDGEIRVVWGEGVCSDGEFEEG